MEVCRNCRKYVFDQQNINRHKRLTVSEYINGVIRRALRTNDTVKQLLKKYGWEENLFVNRSCCELCGAPHAVFSYENMESVVRLVFFFSGLDAPSEKDTRFIEDYHKRFAW